MRIAVITNSYKSPTELWLWRQVKSMQENIGYVGILDKVIEHRDGNIPIVSLVGEGVRKALGPFALLQRISALENEFGIDAYYIHYLTNAYLLKEFIVLTSKKVFVHCHGYDLTFNMKQHQNPGKNFHPPGYVMFTRSLPEGVTYIADSQHARALLIARGVPKEQVKVLYFGVPVEGVNLSKNNDLLKILFLGRLVDFKGPDLTIQAFEEVCAGGLNAELIIVGDGPLMVTCQLLKQRSRFCDRIKLLGTLPYESAKKLREDCHVFTAHNMKGSISNQEEAYGVSIVEAMGAGLPVVTGKSGGITETVIPNETGFLFKPGDIKGHADCLTKLLKNTGMREKMGKTAHEHVLKQFTLQKEKQALLKILRSNEPQRGKERNAVIIGPYRYHNFGDDLLGAIIAKHLQQLRYSVCIPLMGEHNSAWLGLQLHSSTDLAIQASDLIVIGGGGLLGDAGIVPDDYYRLAALEAASKANLAGKRVITTGIGAGPLALDSSKNITLRITALSERVGVRDSESRTFLENLGVDESKIVEGADLALLCSQYLKFQKKESGKIGVQFDVGSFKDIIQCNSNIHNIFSAVRDYTIQNGSKLMLIANGDFNSQLHNRFTTECEILSYKELESFLPRIAGLKAIFTSHLHLAITAYSQRVPCFSLYVREKTKRFYKQIGRPDRAIDLRFASPEDFHRLMTAAETATWTNDDEERLQLLKSDASRLLSFIK